jgi:hypothetical protein
LFNITLNLGHVPAYLVLFYDALEQRDAVRLAALPI